MDDMAMPERPPVFTYTPPTAPYPRPAVPFPPSPPAPPARPGRFRRALAVAALCALSGTAGGSFVRATISSGHPSAAPASASGPSAVAEPPRDDAPITAGTITSVAHAAKPSVVTIEVGGGTGSGVIVSSDGEILTNAHVVESARRVTVRLADGNELQGTVVGTDTDVDIAVVKVDRTGLPAVKIGSALTLRPGDQVVAVGAPLGLEGSVSAGVISALGRYVPDEAGGLRAAIQTDAAINPGNSGGALLDMNANVVGITAAKAGGTSIENIGFAIPIDVARAIGRDITDGRTPSHPYLGISGPEVDAETAKALGDTPGARLDEVQAGTPAAAAGLKTGDVITSIDGTHIGSFFDLSVALATRRAGEKVSIQLSDGRTTSATLAERPRT